LHSKQGSFEKQTYKVMNRLGFTVLLFAVAGITVGHGQQTPTSMEKFAGVWFLVSVENISPDGAVSLPYGNSPKGMMVLSNEGDYTIQILKAIRPKVAANDKNKATPEENAALVQGNNSHYGRYVVNEPNGKITFMVDHAFYPNWEGTVQERSYTLANGVLEYIVTNTTNGGAITARVVWKRKN
jgi:hypothetical protein